VLICGRNFVRRHILPFILVAHATAGNDGHLQFSAAKSPIFHRATG
jgi:hypothetical protein